VQPVIAAPPILAAEASPQLSTSSVETAPPPAPLAGYRLRVISGLVDYVAPVIVLNLLLSIGVATENAVWRLLLTVVGYLGVFGFAVWNSVYLQGKTGQSLGRRVARTKLVDADTAEAVGFARAMGRQLCHIGEFGVGFLWPLWDPMRQTFADKIAATVVVRLDGDQCQATPKITAPDGSS
jgi:uncharacterized RDD family membrane protein YckC